MNYKSQEIKKGIKLHTIKTDKFKTNLYAVFLATPLGRENVTQNALITAILRRGTQNIQSQDQISKRLEEMYGASFDCGVEKTGDNHIIKFYLEAINEEFIPEKEELTKKCIDILFDIIFNPLLKQIIESKIDNKRAYAFERCIEEMFKSEPYGLYKYGYVEDLDKITPQSLYEYYKKLISECKIDIFVSGAGENEKVNKMVENDERIKELTERNPKYVATGVNSNLRTRKEANIVEEHMQVGQGNLVIGMDVNCKRENSKFIASVYNAILGGGTNSKLFQNVREKESLAYVADSTYRRRKNVIFIRCGIEIANFEKSLNAIKKQLDDIKLGNFSEEDINNSKKIITESIRGISSEQDTEITYYYGQELSNNFISLDEYIEKINSVTKEDVQELANEINIDTIYFLRD